MPNPFFQFKQFVVYHDKCAMKVGTDGVLAGAWTRVENARRMLDIGTGSGLIALMLAQRNATASVVAVDIDEGAVVQARENVERSPWKHRIEVCREDIRHVPEDWGTFDVIVSNPPYFVEDVKCPQRQRNTARHTDDLDFEALLSAVARLLSDCGTFSVILPAAAAADFIALALGKGLFLSRQTWVHPREELAAKRVLMEFARHPLPEAEVTRLVIESSVRHVYTPEFENLARPFYLAL